ncbi:MAG TPA: hypothetical protein VIG64_14320 [Actinomycetota bacterium]|jgi:hypothetical protein
MGAPTRESAAVLVIRAWTEDGDETLRARITWSSDLYRPETDSIVTASRDELFAVVDEWLTTVLRGGQSSNYTLTDS